MDASTRPALTTRSGGDADWPAINLVLDTCFGEQESPEAQAKWRSLLPADGVVVGCDGPEVVGVAMFIDLRLTLPGGAVLPTAGLTGVAVVPTHRRRGLLRAMLTELDRRIAAAGYPIAALTATEGGLYGRFGYGAATTGQLLTVHRRHARVHPDVPSPGGVRVVRPADHRPSIEDIYERWRLRTPGGLSASSPYWDEQFAARPDARDGPLFALLHHDGFALYRAEHVTAPASSPRRRQRTVRVTKFAAVTAEAHVALWRALLGLDLMDTIEISTSPDDPLPYLLTDSRMACVTRSADELWLRIVDIPAVLEARRYPTDGSVVLEIGAERFALTVEGGQARCATTSAPPDVHTDLPVLGAILLGGHRPSSFAAAGRLRCDGELLPLLDAMFSTTIPAQLGYGF